MFQEIDCRGLSCPQPVITVKKALENIPNGIIVTIVDNEAAKENLLKLAKGMNFAAEAKEEQGEFRVVISKGDTIDENSHLAISLTKDIDTVEDAYSIMVTANVMGKGNDELGAALIKSFFYTLTEQDVMPSCIAFLNSGVTLTCEDSSVLEHVLNIEARGCEILSCGTCLDFYGIKNKLCVGSVSNMYTILENLQKAGKVITI